MQVVTFSLPMRATTLLSTRPNGAYEGVFASAGMNRPQGIAINSGGNVFVGNLNSISEYSSTGAYLGNFATSNVDSAAHIAFAPNGDLYCANQFSDTISIYQRITGTYLNSISTGNDPFWRCFRCRGDLCHFSNANSDTISEYTPGGALHKYRFQTGSTNPGGLAF